jgi:outer membrane protein OmpA-like peptidoglycan-associated protein
VAPWAVAGNIWSKRMEDKRKQMEAATQGTGVEVTRTADNRLQVNVPSDISFDVGRSALRPALHPVLDKFASGLDGSMKVMIVGHTDSTGSDAINDPLSVDRAASVRDYLVMRGVSPTRISIEGKGSHQPIADNSTAEGRARNRRVEIFLSEAQPKAEPGPRRRPAPSQRIRGPAPKIRRFCGPGAPCAGHTAHRPAAVDPP